MILRSAFIIPKPSVMIKSNFTGDHEILSLNGLVNRMNGKPYVHIHMSAANEDLEVVGGHLNSAFVSAAAVIFITLTQAKTDREYMEEIGLNLIKF